MDKQLEDALIEATTEFGITYAVADEAEKEADKAKARFYELADQELETRRLPRKTIKPTALVGDVEEYVKKYWPEWRIVEDGPNGVIVEKDPSKMKYAFPNLEDGQLYQRTYQDKGKPSIDIERLKEEDPELWAEVSEWDPTVLATVQSAIIWTLTWAKGGAGPDQGPAIGDIVGDLSTDDMQQMIDTWFESIHPEHRILKPSVAWSQGQSGRLQKYLIPPGITVKIVKPRPIKEEDLINDGE